jgi:hypothetical protein
MPIIMDTMVVLLEKILTLSHGHSGVSIPYSLTGPRVKKSKKTFGQTFHFLSKQLMFNSL